MLVSLAISNIVLIERASLDWAGGFTALTGETGAGKSVLLDALSLASGQRGDVGLVRQGCEQGEVTALFEIAPDHPAQNILAEAGIADTPTTEIILRRSQNADGRSRAYCNDKPISVGKLREIGSSLVEIHGQHESQALTDAATQRGLLDMFGGLEGAAAKVAAAWEAQAAAVERLAAARENLAQTIADKEYLAQSLQDLQDIAPQAGEEAELAQTRDLLLNAEKITADLDTIAQHLADEGREQSISAALRRLEQMAGAAGGVLGNTISAIDKMLIETQEARANLADTAAGITHDPAKLEATEARLFSLRDLAKKHNVECEQLPSVMVELETRLAAIEDASGNIAALESAAAKAAAAYTKAATELSKQRIAAAAKLDKRVGKELAPLKLDGGLFRTAIETCEAGQGGAHGLDKITFEAATNKGIAPAPIAKIASGGELARFMLALKVSVLAGSQHSTLIFDEVDAGVGGAVAEAVGLRLAELGRSAQVLVVTHAPQVAARAGQHYLVAKEKSQTLIAPLSAEERLDEIARMLSGANITDEARAAAHKLLEAQ